MSLTTNRYNTPLRYPGGKQRLTPFVAEVLRANSLEGGHYVEPYAGGAGVAMQLLLGDLVEHVHLNDACPAIYDFWRVVLTQSAALCDRIQSASMTVSEWRRQRAIFLQPAGHPQLDRAFSLLYLNRCNRSGIPSGGLIGGLHQTGEWRMDARFPRNELIRRVEAIAAKRKAITVTNLDAEKFLLTRVSKLPLNNTLVYCDPPYFHKAERLYRNHYSPADHDRIAAVIQTRLKQPWLVSYDAAEPILDAYRERSSFTYSLQYSAGKPYKGTEVFFFCDGLQLPEDSVVPCISAALSAA